MPSPPHATHTRCYLYHTHTTTPFGTFHFTITLVVHCLPTHTHYTHTAPLHHHTHAYTTLLPLPPLPPPTDCHTLVTRYHLPYIHFLYTRTHLCCIFFFFDFTCTLPLPTLFPFPLFVHTLVGLIRFGLPATHTCTHHLPPACHHWFSCAHYHHCYARLYLLLPTRPHTTSLPPPTTFHLPACVDLPFVLSTLWFCSFIL